MEKIAKTATQVAEQIERWFLKYHKCEKSVFNGSEPFTIFQYLYFEKQNELISRIGLNKHEIPVLVLTIENNRFIINTTERFIWLHDAGTESLYYQDFDCHKGYKSISAKEMTIKKIASIKSEGLFAEFGLQKTDGQIIYWMIPTGRPGFAFWNMTNKCSIIGRKYLIKNNE